ncbi:MAG TPA: hypothetical protein VF711_00510 [Acidimicrobiales bacterium]|jgi:hypothetical protein
MAYTCETCGKVMQSEGSFGLHELTAHVGGAGVAAGPVPAGAQWAPPAPPGTYGQFPDPYGRYGSRPRRRSNPLVVVFGAIGVVFALLVIGSLVAITVFGGKAKPAQVALVDPASPPPLPADFKQVFNSDDGFLIGIPASFDEVPLTAGSVGSAADALESTNGNLAALLRENADNLETSRLFAIDMASGNNQQVQRIILDGAATIDDVPSGTFAGEYRKNGVSDVMEQRVHLPAGDALKVTVKMSGGFRDALVTQHVLVRDSTAWILTYAQDPGSDTSEATTIASTFGWTK